MAASPESLPDMASLQVGSQETVTSVVSRLFEPSDLLETVAIDILGGDKALASYEDLINHIEASLRLLTSSQPTSLSSTRPASLETPEQRLYALDTVLRCHPRLGEKRVDSAASRAEQARLQGTGAQAEREAALLKDLNSQYEQTFPSLIFLSFVNGRGRPEIMDEMRMRIQRADLTKEREESITALCEIARDRVRKFGVSQP